eukprot:scaffold523_cov237-Pinguiococcus_pyrenoidosus.AAC.5
MVQGRGRKRPLLEAPEGVLLAAERARQGSDLLERVVEGLLKVLRLLFDAMRRPQPLLDVVRPRHLAGHESALRRNGHLLELVGIDGVAVGLCDGQLHAAHEAPANALHDAAHPVLRRAPGLEVRAQRQLLALVADGGENGRGRSGFPKLEGADAVEALADDRLHGARVGVAPKDLEELLVAEKVEPRELLPLDFQIVLQALLDALEGGIVVLKQLQHARHRAGSQAVRVVERSPHDLPHARLHRGVRFRLRDQLLLDVWGREDRLHVQPLRLAPLPLVKRHGEELELCAPLLDFLANRPHELVRQDRRERHQRLLGGRNDLLERAQDALFARRRLQLHDGQIDIRPRLLDAVHDVAEVLLSLRSRGDLKEAGGLRHDALVNDLVDRDPGGAEDLEACEGMDVVPMALQQARLLQALQHGEGVFEPLHRGLQPRDTLLLRQRLLKPKHARPEAAHFAVDLLHVVRVEVRLLPHIEEPLPLVNRAPQVQLARHLDLDVAQGGVVEDVIPQHSLEVLVVVRPRAKLAHLPVQLLQVLDRPGGRRTGSVNGLVVRLRHDDLYIRRQALDMVAEHVPEALRLALDELLRRRHGHLGVGHQIRQHERRAAELVVDADLVLCQEVVQIAEKGEALIILRHLLRHVSEEHHEAHERRDVRGLLADLLAGGAQVAHEGVVLVHVELRQELVERCATVRGAGTQHGVDFANVQADDAEVFSDFKSGHHGLLFVQLCQHVVHAGQAHVVVAREAALRQERQVVHKLLQVRLELGREGPDSGERLGQQLRDLVQDLLELQRLDDHELQVQAAPQFTQVVQDRLDVQLEVLANHHPRNLGHDGETLEEGVLKLVLQAFLRRLEVQELPDVVPWATLIADVDDAGHDLVEVLRDLWIWPPRGQLGRIRDGIVQAHVHGQERRQRAQWAPLFLLGGSKLVSIPLQLGGPALRRRRQRGLLRALLDVQRKDHVQRAHLGVLGGRSAAFQVIANGLHRAHHDLHVGIDDEEVHQPNQRRQLPTVRADGSLLREGGVLLLALRVLLARRVVMRAYNETRRAWSDGNSLLVPVRPEAGHGQEPRQGRGREALHGCQHLVSAVAQPLHHRMLGNCLLLDEFLDRHDALVQEVDVEARHLHADAPKVQQAVPERLVQQEQVGLELLGHPGALARPDHGFPLVKALGRAKAREERFLDEALVDVVLPLKLLDGEMLRGVVGVANDGPFAQDNEGVALRTEPLDLVMLYHSKVVGRVPLRRHQVQEAAVPAGLHQPNVVLLREQPSPEGGERRGESFHDDAHRLFDGVQATSANLQRPKLWPRSGGGSRLRFLEKLPQLLIVKVAFLA